MSRCLYPTPYADVNAVLQTLAVRIQAILADHFVGMYLYGSLALGDFDPNTSDIDFIVVTKGEIDGDRCGALQEMHTQFDAGGYPWAARVEAAYIPQEALHHTAPTQAKYPQVEKGTRLFIAPLETGWAFQLHSLRENGVVVAGPAPRTITGPVDRASMGRAVAAIAGGWQEQAAHDPEWLEWVRRREAQSFVVLTLCRMLYSLATGEVASKPAAARWARQALEARWAPIIDRAMMDRVLFGQHDEEEATEGETEETLEFIRYTVEKSWAGEEDSR